MNVRTGVEKFQAEAKSFGKQVSRKLGGGKPKLRIRLLYMTRNNTNYIGERALESLGANLCKTSGWWQHGVQSSVEG